MDLFEYQGKELLRRFEVPVPEGRVARTPDEAYEAARGLGGKVVVKAQVLIGGRGKAGGIKLASSPEEARNVAQDILGMDIRGHTVRMVLVERAGDIAAEYYAS
ncbi:MAG: ATP-grasp domain-containing protein, partial [Actinomycetota bacterium]